MPRANDNTRPVMLTAAAARRVSRAVAAYERGNRDQPPITFRTGGDDSPIRICKTTAAWPKGQLATLEVWEDGTPPNEAKTTGLTIADVVNKYANVASGKFCSIALHANGYWYLIAAEC